MSVGPPPPTAPMLPLLHTCPYTLPPQTGNAAWFEVWRKKSIGRAETTTPFFVAEL